MLKNEIRIFFTAVMFYTRIPTPKWVGYSAENLNKATRYFPLIGTIVGAVGAGAFMGANYLFSIKIALLFSLGIMILLTGAFHEDALSDFCDGFGGGYSKEKILSIMKDSRIGTYGATALVLLLLSKFFILSEINANILPIVIISAHSFSRLFPVLLIFSAEYVRDDSSSKSKPVGEKCSSTTLFVAILFSIIPLYFIPYQMVPFFIITASAIFIYFRYYVIKKIGGYTGDVLGALQQITEIGFYITFLALTNLK